MKIEVSQSARGCLKTSRLAVLGTGQVSRAFVTALACSKHQSTFPIVQVSNTRGCIRMPAGSYSAERFQRLLSTQLEPRSIDPIPDIGDDIAVVIDATSSDCVASLHAGWLRQGISVITANKRGLGEHCERAIQIESAMAFARYGDSATVGAGLGAIQRLRELTASGRTVTKIEGVLSGTMGWIFSQLDSGQDFGTLVREAHRLGYTEPDPRDDIGGLDTARKLRILARAAGWPVLDDSIRLDERLQAAGGSDLWAEIDQIGERVKDFSEQGRRIGLGSIVTAKGTASSYDVGLEWIGSSSVLAQRVGCDNVLAVWCEHGSSMPMVFRGPGAGAALTAKALLSDLISLECLPS